MNTPAVTAYPTVRTDALAQAGLFLVFWPLNTILTERDERKTGA